tara:strand:- start:125 stop:1000 length:876 start_codon:yes stop_codon:yes gene_type:complete
MATTGSNRPNVQPGGLTGQSPYTDDIGSGSFGFSGKIPIEYLEFLIGTEIFSLFGDSMINESFETAFREISDMLPDDIILENLGESSLYSETNESIHSAKGFSYGKRILRVMRQNHIDEDTSANTQYFYPCRKISQHNDNAFNPNSIYYENDPFDPIWYVHDNGGIKIAPKNSSAEPSGKVYYMAYPKFGIGIDIDTSITHDLGPASGRHNFSLIGASDEDYLFFGIPENVRTAVYLTTAINLSSGYLSNHVQDDEDVELVQLLSSQLEWLAGKKTAELKMISQMYGLINE